MHEDDQIRLRHMLEACREVFSFTEGKSRLDLDADRKLVLAVVKCIEIIGEAGNNVSQQGRGDLPGIPWQDVIDMRHRLIHSYYDVNLDIVWSTIQEDLPPLLAELERAVET